MRLVTLLMMVALYGCSKTEDTPLLYEVEAQPFSVEVPARGELFAAKATVISAPISRNGMQIIAWLAPEFSAVKAGDVIARFDGEAMEVESLNKEKERAMVAHDIVEKDGGLNQELQAINKDIIMVAQERFFSEKYSIDDVRIRSKLDILDSMQNTEYLGSKESYLKWKNESFSESSEGDMGLLKMKLEQHESKLAQLKSSLSQLEVKAPHDGLLAYSANWRGEKPRAGQSMWPGQKIAELPDITEMKAKLFVLESEAIDLAEGQAVSFRLNALTEQEFKGHVDNVAPFPNSIKRGDPQKYFEVTVTLEQQNTEYFLPSRKLEANITVAQSETKLIVPLQSIFSEKNKRFVYVYEGGQYQQVEVELGQASLSHVEVLSGLISGQKISLVAQGEGV